jgi:cation-transporting ATPase 13A2
MRSSDRSRRRISRDSSVLGRSRKDSRISNDSRRSLDRNDSALSDSHSAVSGTPSGPASSRRIGSKRKVPRRSEEESRGMLGSLMASFRGESSEALSSARRPSFGRNRSSQSSVSRRSDRGNDDDDLDNDDESIHSDTYDDDDDAFSESMSNSSSEEDSHTRGGFMPSAFGPLSGAVDPVFGDSRTAMERPPTDGLDLELGGHSDEEAPNLTPFVGSHDPVSNRHQTSEDVINAAREEAKFTDKDCTSRQQIYLADDDCLIRFTGYETIAVRQAIYIFVCIITLGIVYLLGRWLPHRRYQYICRECDFDKAEFVVVQNQWGDLLQIKPSTVAFARPLATVFPLSSSDPASTLSEHQVNTLEPTALPPALKPTKANGKSNGHAAGGDIKDDLPMLAGVETEQLMDLTLLEYRYTRFALHPPSGRWRMTKDWRDPMWVSTTGIAKGISWDSEKDRKTLFGGNVIDIESKSTLTLLVDEVLHPFYIFQVASVLLWSLDNYYYYAICIVIISCASIITTLIETRNTVKRMREMSRFSCRVNVLREGKWEAHDSTDLVPGDIYDVAESGLLLFPADSVLLSGDAIVNESMLTGESVPVSKVPLSNAQMHLLHSTESQISSELAKHFLFSGTRIIRIRPTNDLAGEDEAGAKAMVVRTGFDTTKGALVRSMLFPKPMGFKFYRDSFRFIGFLGAIAGVGFLASAVNFVKLGIAWHTILVRALDLITVVVPPALPATMSIGTSFAISRLRKAGVYCISPNRVNIGGKVNVFCFDKTGTLTADGLDVLGSRTVDVQAKRFNELHEAVNEMPVNTKGMDAETKKLPLLHALATCHSLKVVDGEVIGDPLDVKMFEYTGWTLDEGKDASAKATTKSGTAKDGKSRLTDRAPALVQTVVRPPGGQSFEVEDVMRSGKHAHFLELGVLRTFEFVSALRRMSVIVKQLKSSSMEVFVKGAPEVMTDICDPDSFPKDYDDLLNYYTKHGYRVIACAGKTMPGMSWIKAQRMKREQAESGLRFIGLMIFENKIKEGTGPAIQTLMDAGIVTKMATGDNPRTAISVARECGMVGPSAHVFLPTFIKGSQKTADAVIDWSSVDDERVKLDSYKLKPLAIDPHVFDIEELDFQDYQLALTGDVFRWMIDFAPIETLRRMLIKGTVFARMSPDEKHELVERLQALGYTVGMCGDGANDCGALKAADVGISLSEAEASVAAPFTSRSPDISCVIEVIKEGRAALVTSFSCFKYMALYSLIQFVSISLLYSFASSLSDGQFLYVDLFCVLPVAVAMARTLPYPHINRKRPTANLVSKKVLVSMLGQVIICGFAQTFTFWYTRAQPWYEPPVVNPDELNVQNPENSALFLVSAFQYLIVAAAFSAGPPYRQRMYTNRE